MARSFTELHSNKLFVSRLETSGMLNFLRSRQDFTASDTLADVELYDLPHPDVVADLLHEVCHFWCFDSYVGQAISLVDLRQRFWAHMLPEGARLEKLDVARLLAAKSLIVPLAEGLAQFAEFDVWRSEHFGETPTPIALMELLFSHIGLNVERHGFLVDRALEKYRDSPAFVQRKANFYEMAFETGQGYVPGYMAAKNLAFLLHTRFPAIKKEAVLAFLKDYFWNDPVFARSIIVGEEPKADSSVGMHQAQAFALLETGFGIAVVEPPGASSPSSNPISDEELYVWNALLAKKDAGEARRDYYRIHYAGGAAKFYPNALVLRFRQRVDALCKDASLGGKLGAVQSRIEHGAKGPLTWEIGVDMTDIERFKAAEIELRSYAFNFYKKYRSVNSASGLQQHAWLIAMLPEYRRVSPLMTIRLEINDTESVICRPLSHTEPFTLPRGSFAELEPGTYTYFLACNANTLAVMELIADTEFQPVLTRCSAASLDRFFGSEGWDDSKLKLYLSLFFMHQSFASENGDFVAKAEATAADDVQMVNAATRISMEFYLDVATIFITNEQRREEVRARLKVDGPKGFLPPSVSGIELAAKLSLLNNAASSPEEFASYISMNLGEAPEFDFDHFRKRFEEILNSDPDQLIFRHVNGRIISSI